MVAQDSCSNILSIVSNLLSSNSTSNSNFYITYDFVSTYIVSVNEIEFIWTSNTQLYSALRVRYPLVALTLYSSTYMPTNTDFGDIQSVINDFYYEGPLYSLIGVSLSSNYLKMKISNLTTRSSKFCALCPVGSLNSIYPRSTYLSCQCPSNSTLTYDGPITTITSSGSCLSFSAILNSSLFSSPPAPIFSRQHGFAYYNDSLNIKLPNFYSTNDTTYFDIKIICGNNNCSFAGLLMSSSFDYSLVDSVKVYVRSVRDIALNSDYLLLKNSVSSLPSVFYSTWSSTNFSLLLRGPSILPTAETFNNASILGTRSVFSLNFETLDLLDRIQYMFKLKFNGTEYDWKLFDSANAPLIFNGLEVQVYSFCSPYPNSSISKVYYNYSQYTISLSNYDSNFCSSLNISILSYMNNCITFVVGLVICVLIFLSLVIYILWKYKIIDFHNQKSSIFNTVFTEDQVSKMLSSVFVDINRGSANIELPMMQTKIEEAHVTKKKVSRKKYVDQPTRIRPGSLLYNSKVNSS